MAYFRCLDGLLNGAWNRCLNDVFEFAKNTVINLSYWHANDFKIN